MSNASTVSNLEEVEDMDADDEVNEEGVRLAMGLIEKYPEDFNHLEYIKYLKNSLIINAKDDIVVKRIIEPFYRTLASSERKRGSSSSRTEDIYIYSEEEMANKNMKILTLMLKVKATVTAVVHDNKLPKREHQIFLRSLAQHIVDMLVLTGPVSEEKYREALYLASHGIGRLSALSLPPGEEECRSTLCESGVEFMLNFLADYIINDYENAAVQMNKTELVSDILHYLKRVPIRRKMLGILCSAVKASLNRINRASRNENNHCLLPMNEVETLFRYLMIIETIVISLPFIQETELVTLRCIERTVFSAMKYPLIGLYVTRIATLAGTSSESLQDKKTKINKPPQFHRRSTKF